MRFRRRTNYGIDLIIKRFHEENSSIMSGLFSKNNLLLCCMQGNNGLSAKTLKNFQSHLHSHSVLTFDKHQICSASCCILEQQNEEFVIQILYLMVLLCVIFKRVWYARHCECSCKRCSCSTENNLQSDFKKLQEKLLTINKRNKVRGNTYRDNNFHLRRQVLRLKRLWKSWVMQALAYKQPCRFML